jgi:hypothetical protein
MIEMVKVNTKRKRKRKPVEELKIEVNGNFYFVTEVDGKETERTKIDGETVAIILRDYVEKAISKLYDELSSESSTEKYDITWTDDGKPVCTFLSVKKPVVKVKAKKKCQI